jgi:hypothetical protein
MYSGGIVKWGRNKKVRREKGEGRSGRLLFEDAAGRREYGAACYGGA